MEVERRTGGDFHHRENGGFMAKKKYKILDLFCKAGGQLMATILPDLKWSG